MPGRELLPKPDKIFAHDSRPRKTPQSRNSLEGLLNKPDHDEGQKDHAGNDGHDGLQDERSQLHATLEFTVS